MPIVISTLSNDVIFCNYKRTEDGTVYAQQKVTILGKARIPQDRRQWGELRRDPQLNALFYAEGVVTKISDEAWEWLKEKKYFNNYVKAGNLKVLHSFNNADDHRAVDKFAQQDMSNDDGFGLLTESKMSQIQNRMNLDGSKLNACMPAGE